MGLLAWYPLDGNLEDYSGSGNKAIATNTTIDSNGKIGKAYNFNNDYITIDNPMQGNIFTISMWAKFNDSTTTHCLFSSRSSLGLGISMFVFNSGALRFDAGGQWSIPNYTAPTNTWVHFTFVKDGDKKLFYVNGSLISSMTSATEVVSTYSKASIGASQISMSDFSNYLKGNVNDVRIYDEALSLKEIKEISKAKILHYNFNQFAESTENLASTGIVHYAPYHDMALTDNGLKFTIKDANKFIVINKTNFNPKNKKLTFSGTLKKNGVPMSFPSNTASTYQPQADSIKTDSSGYFEVVQSFPNDSSWLLHFYVTSVVGDVFTIENFMIEEKNHSTPYTKNVRTDRVTDSSGFRNHSQPLTLANTPQWTEDSVMGSGCYRFTKDKNQIISQNATIGGLESYTASVWVRMNDFVVNEGLGTIMSISQDGSSYPLSIFIIPDGRLEINSFSNVLNDTFTSSLTLNKWTHIAVSSTKGGKTCVYVNGIKQSEYTNKGVAIPTNAKVYIGDLRTGRKLGINGSIDDVRLYATALSDEDIKELYQSRGSISKNGKLMINEIVEFDNLFNPKLILDRQKEIGVNSSSKITTKDGIECLALSASSFYKSSTFHSIFPSGYFKTNTQYKIDLMANGNLIYQGNEVPFGFRIFYTDGSSQDCVGKTAGTWKNFTFTTTANKTIDRFGVYYYIGDLFYLDIKNCSIRELDNKSNVSKKGQLITSELYENNYKPSLLDYSRWTLTSPDNWSNNGSASENCRVVYSNPRGNMDIMWATLSNDATSDGDGGFNSPIVNIDKTKRYRFSVWIRRENIGDGRTYFGLNGYDSSTVENGLLTISGASIINPYFTSFISSDPFGVASNNGWILMVAYVHPSDYTGGTLSTNGVYKPDGTKVGGMGDYKWSTTASKTKLRAYLFYSTSTAERQYFYRPRIDLCDGSEPSIEELLSCNEHLPLADIGGKLLPKNTFSFGKNGATYSTEFIEN